MATRGSDMQCRFVLRIANIRVGANLAQNVHNLGKAMPYGDQNRCLTMLIHRVDIRSTLAKLFNRFHVTITCSDVQWCFQILNTFKVEWEKLERENKKLVR